jgi:plasmid stability protein
MASITIRKLAEKTKKKLRVRAAQHGRSMEEEARRILAAALGETEPAKPENMYDTFRRHFEPLGSVTLKIPPRGKTIRTPRFPE